ncbi:MAG: ISKra4 family transposase [Cyanobacteriota bacterium]
MRETIVAEANKNNSAQEKFDEIVAEILSAEMMRAEHGEIERYLKIEGFELLRRMMQEHLDLRAESEPRVEVKNSQGIEMTRARASGRQLETIFGRVEIDRLGYSKRGMQQLYPSDGELNLPPDLYSHGVRRIVAESVSKESFDEVVAQLQSSSGARVAKRQVEEMAQQVAKDFDAFYDSRSNAAVPASASILVITTDAKGVVMRKEDLREATRKAAEGRTPKMNKRTSRGEKRNAKRMSQVASVYTIEPYLRTPEQIAGQMHPVRAVETKRPRPQQKRVWASLEKEPADVILEAFEEAIKRDPDKQKHWVAVVDGNETQLELIKAGAWLKEVNITIVLDIIHVVEYLWKASYVFNDKESKAAESWVSDRLLEILRGHSSQVAAGIRRSATLRELSIQQREPADDCADYLLKYAPYLRYHQYLAQGFPIASGVIEGACRYLVKDRMDLTGARWRLKGAEAVLKLRSLRASGDFDDYWRFHLQRELQRNHISKFIDGRLPLQDRPSSHLHLVS